MAACGPMIPTRRLAGVARKATIWTAVAATAVAVVSCGRVVDGHAKLAIPKIGAPIAWDRCIYTSPDDAPAVASTQCGKLGVPVDYSKPDADVASIALVKFPATGAKIGSLVVNPGGPGESGVDAALSLVRICPRSFGSGSISSGSTHEAFAPSPPCGATPMPTTTSFAPIRRSTTAQRA